MSKVFFTKVLDVENVVRIGRVGQGDHPPVDGDEWFEAPNNWGGNDGDKLSWFDDTMHRINDDDLVEQGKRIDNRGLWYNKETREPKNIDRYDVPIDEAEYTREAPIPNELHQKWDEGEGCFIVDTEKKERAEKEAELADVRAQMDKAEKEIIRPLRAIRGNRATPEDIEIYDSLDDLLENVLRPEQDRLKAELKSA